MWGRADPSRGPCLCNPGAASSVLRGIGFEDWQKTVFSESGIIRISLGIASNFADCYKFVKFCKELASVLVYNAGFSTWNQSIKVPPTH
jgi:molybdenum cofactor sulfurtransferase